MMMLISKTEIIAKLSEEPYIKALEEVCRKSGVVCHLTGGAVRDIILGKNPSDYDIYVSEELSVPILWHVMSKISGIDIHRIDIKYASDMNRVVDEFDFTINAIIYNITERELSDPHGGIRSLRKRRLDYVYPLFFTTAAVPFFRIERFYHELGLTPSPRLLSLLYDCTEMVNIGDAWSRAYCFSEFIRVLSGEDSLLTKGFSNVVRAAFPVFFPVDVQYMVMTAELEESSEMTIETAIVGGRRFTTHYSPLGVARLALLLGKIPEAYLGLGELDEYYESEDFQAKMLDQLVNSLRNTIKLNPINVRVLNQALDIANKEGVRC